MGHGEERHVLELHFGVDGGPSDKLYFVLGPGFSDEWDQFDVLKLNPLAYSEKKWAIEQIRDHAAMQSLQRSHHMPETEPAGGLINEAGSFSGEVTARFRIVDSNDPGWRLVMTDQATGGSYQLGDNGEFVFNGMSLPSQKNQAAHFGRLMSGSEITARFSYALYPSGMSVSNDDDQAVFEFSLAQNFPNPFNPETTIRYSIRRPATATIEVFNVIGRRVFSQTSNHSRAGFHSVSINASAWASGVYVYRLSVEGQSLSGKMVLVK